METAKNITSLIQKACKQRGPQTLYKQGTEKLTYDQYDKLSSSLATFFQKKWNLKKGDVVLIQLPSILSYPIAVFAAYKVGLVVANSNFMYTENECRTQWQLLKPKALIVSPLSSSKWKSILPDDFECIMEAPILSLKTGLVQKLIHLFTKIKFKAPLSFGTSFLSAIQTPEDISPVSIDESDTACLQCTGGTTGGIKAAVLTHKNLLSNAKQISELMEVPLKKNPKDFTAISPLPLYHIYAFNLALLSFPSLGVITDLIVNPKDTHNLAQKLINEKWNVFIGINTLFKKLMEYDSLNQISETENKICIAGGMKLEKSVYRDWKKVTKIAISEGYGLTEASPVLCFNDLENPKEDSCGKAIPNTELKILKDSPEDTEGELIAKGPQVMDSYYENPEATKQVFTQDGWLRTGDIARIDEEGFVYILDRSKDMVIVSGFNVYSSDVENCLMKHSKVADAAIIGVPDKRTGEKVKAFIVKHPSEELSCEELTAHCRNHLTAYKVPKEFTFIEEIPKTPVGKHLKKELRKL